MSSKKGVEEKKLGHKIINVTYPDNTPFGWAFDNFYDAKDFVKHLSNRDGKVADARLIRPLKTQLHFQHRKSDLLTSPLYGHLASWHHATLERGSIGATMISIIVFLTSMLWAIMGH